MDLFSRLAEWANANEGLLQALAMFGGLGALFFSLARQRSEAASLQRARIALPATVVVQLFAEDKAHELRGILASFGGSIEDEESRFVVHFANADEAARAAVALRPRIEGGDAAVLVCERGASFPDDDQGRPGAIVATAPIRRALRDAPDIETVSGGSEDFPFEIKPAPEPSAWRSLRRSALPIAGISLVLVAGLWWLSGPGDKRPLVVEDPKIKYATTSDGVKIAYWTVGEGPVLIVNDFKLSAHIDLQWRIPEVQRWFRALATEYRIVRFSPRGSGLSGLGYLESSLDEMALDVLAVADALGAEEIIVLSMGAMGAISVRFATLHPNRVAALVLFNASGLYGADYDQMAAAIDATSRMDIEARLVWGMDVLGIPPENRPEYRPWLEAWARQMSPDDYARVLRKHGTWNVRDELPAMTTPALVMQRPESMPPTQGPELASALPNAELVILEGKGFMPYVGFTDDEVKVVKEFLREVFKTP